MGSRAGYAVVQDRSTRLFYAHYGAPYLHLDLLPGPEPVTRYFRGLREIAYPLDDGWAEGAAVLDHDRKRLVFYTEHIETYAEHAAVMSVLAGTWPGWQVSYAYDGMADVAAATGNDPSLVRPVVPVPDIEWVEPAERRDRFIHCLVTTRDEAGVRAYALQNHGREVYDLGPELFVRLGPLEPVSECWCIPYTGFHFDLTTRTAGLWTFDSLDGRLQHLDARWPDWRWEFWENRYQEHSSRTNGTVTFPEPDLRTAYTDLRHRYEEYFNSPEDPEHTRLRALLDKRAAGPLSKYPSPPQCVTERRQSATS
ncbi:hypothetical protein ACFQ07_30765 [Actinomadura adrarensis]|uniref:Uncharacterized protein n=1 Tax=Actinomadura adrarensis TaxID=1819600 RepID=A0ABW3CSX5_9ACTN